MEIKQNKTEIAIWPRAIIKSQMLRFNFEKEEMKIDNYYYCNFTVILYKIYYFS